MTHLPPFAKRLLWLLAGAALFVFSNGKWIIPAAARMAVFRAMENGFALVRHTGEGLSLATDCLGRTIASMDYFTSSDRRLTAVIPIKGYRTIYARIGDAFAWLCILGLLATPILTRLKTRFFGIKNII